MPPRRLTAALLFAGALLALAPGAAHAQGGRPLDVSPRQPLTFGNIWSGTPARIARTDPLRSGQIELRGQRLTPVQVTLTLPGALTGPGGATLPLVFGGDDGGASQTDAIAAAAGFDPRVPLTTQFSNNGRLYLYLGVTAVPAARQTAGAYTATVSVTVAYTGT